MRFGFNPALFALVLAVAACSSSTSPSNNGTGGHSLTIDANPNLTFRPTPDTVTAGSAVSFAWHSVAHNVQFDTPGAPANIGSGLLGFTSGDSTRVFPTAGTYNYHCRIHGLSMSGSIVVQ